MALLPVLVLVACGGHDTVWLEPGAVDPDALGSQSGAGAMSDSSAAPSPVAGPGTRVGFLNLDDEASPDEARSMVDIWMFDRMPMSTQFVHSYQPAAGSWPTVISLMYGARDRHGHAIGLEWPYDGHAVSYGYDHLTVVPSYVWFGDNGKQRVWRVAAGNVSLLPLQDGRVRVELSGLAIVEMRGTEEGPPEPIADGFVTGDVVRVCTEYVPSEDAPVDGTSPTLQARRDDDWSSEFCSQFAAPP